MVFKNCFNALKIALMPTKASESQKVEDPKQILPEGDLYSETQSTTTKHHF